MVPPLLLAHHTPDAYHRCVKIGSIFVCRRCLSLWPLTLGMIVMQLSPWRGGPELESWLYFLAAPASLEFVLERTGKLHYSPYRTIAGSLLLAMPLGRGFARYMVNPLDPWFWTLVLTCGIPAGVAFLYGLVHPPE